MARSLVIVVTIISLPLLASVGLGFIQQELYLIVSGSGGIICALLLSLLVYTSSPTKIWGNYTGRLRGSHKLFAVSAVALILNFCSSLVLVLVFKKIAFFVSVGAAIAALVCIVTAYIVANQVGRVSVSQSPEDGQENPRNERLPEIAEPQKADSDEKRGQTNPIATAESGGEEERPAEKPNAAS